MFELVIAISYIAYLLAMLKLTDRRKVSTQLCDMLRYLLYTIVAVLVVLAWIVSSPIVAQYRRWIVYRKYSSYKYS